jgi:hypothetical protein
MAKPFKLVVFGKAGCDKCKMLKKRTDDLLASAEWADFEQEYCDVETEEGLIEFCRAECINPTRIPALVVMRQESGTYRPVPVAEPERSDPLLGKSRLYHVLGLQTDYSAQGRGVLSPKMIQAILSAARAAVEEPVGGKE